MVYSDILFDNDALNKLLRSDEDITLLVDRTFDSKSYAPDRRLDLVMLADPPPPTRRALDVHATSTIRQIGTRLDPSQAHCEFAGLALFSEKGYQLFRETYYSAVETTCTEPRRSNGDTPFHEVPSARQASFTDVIQEIIDRGHKVACVEVSAGWMEIHSFDDYKQACALLRG